MITNPSSMSVGFLAVFQGYVKECLFGSERGFRDLIFSVVLSVVLYWLPAQGPDFDA